jgi:3-phenylpropionate/trans-cinnamate dioxygenase ferredoxin reductase subunit
MRLQMAGLLPSSFETVRRSGANATSFTLFHMVGDKLLCAESANAPLDHMMSRKLIEARVALNKVTLADHLIPLKSFLA